MFHKSVNISVNICALKAGDVRFEMNSNLQTKLTLKFPKMHILGSRRISVISQMLPYLSFSR